MDQFLLASGPICRPWSSLGEDFPHCLSRFTVERRLCPVYFEDRRRGYNEMGT